MKPNRIGQIAIPAAIVGIVVMMVVPLPTSLLDLLLVMNITGALLVLLVSHVGHPRRSTSRSSRRCC